jgi:3-phenylpropionate/cinnamic acid dioxygenase small subunit
MNDRMMSDIEQRRIEAFLIYEAELLDNRRFEEWEQLFDEDGYYWVPTRPDQENPYDELSIFFDDRQLMRTRIARLRHPRMHVEDPPTRAVRLVGSIRVEPEAPSGADVAVASKLFMATYRLGEQVVYAAHCRHALRVRDAGFKIAWKKVTLVNCDAAFDPLTVPF